MKKLFSFLFAVAFMAGALYIYARFVEPNLLVVKYENIKSSRINEDAPDLKIVQFSDTHISEYFDMRDLKRVAEKINAENPDIVVFTGDLIDEYKSYENKENINEIWEILGSINAPHGKYAVYGNHDYGGGAERIYGKIMEESGFLILKNEKVEFEDYNISVTGMDDAIFGISERDRLAALADEGSYNIVLSHEPDVVDYMLEYNIDLFLAGHSHGGQVNLPFVNVLPPLGEKYSAGMYSFNNYRQTLLYVNIGLGTTKMPLRFMAPPELTVLVLSNEKQNE